MSTKPSLIAVCTECGRENVGVVLDWSHRDKNEKILPRYRMARHKIKYGADDKSVPYCLNSRNMVPKEAIFDVRNDKPLSV